MNTLGLVSRQENGFDCALYMIKFISSFLELIAEDVKFTSEDKVDNFFKTISMNSKFHVTPQNISIVSKIGNESTMRFQMYNMIFSMINIPPWTTASNKLDTVAVSQHHQARPRPLVQKKSLNIEQQKSSVFPYCQGTVKAIGKEPDLSVNKHVGDDLFTPPRTAFLKTSAYPNYLTSVQSSNSSTVQDIIVQEQSVSIPINDILISDKIKAIQSRLNMAEFQFIFKNNHASGIGEQKTAKKNNSFFIIFDYTGLHGVDCPLDQLI